ncbi:CD276 antigen-like [Stegostoma tigrinum]|uniref:CD276 antigen-like n=1 Tax=Stegostoma tigrinum TaxID=3053191 RepID=UPI00202B3B53|nr:CD276 antigen-like [Stegostoma tigrinum]
MKYLLYMQIMSAQVLLSGAFEVAVSKTTLVGIHKQSIVLGCHFTVDSDLPLDHIIITWQRAKNRDVVHSYYYGKDQLSLQSEQYLGRTSLFPEEFKHGNASLMLTGMRAEDAGQYVCFVSNVLGSAKGTISLKFAAYYWDPQLLIKLQSSSSTFILESQGYPEPSVFWYCAEDKNVFLQPEISFDKSEDGLYSFQIILKVDNAKLNCNHVVEIQNSLVNQTVTRKFNLLLLQQDSQRQNPNKNVWIALSSCTILIFAAIIVMVLLICKRKHTQQQKIEEKRKCTLMRVIP